MTDHYLKKKFMTYIFDSSLHETIFRIKARLKVKATVDFTPENVSVSSNNSNVSGSDLNVARFRFRLGFILIFTKSQN